VQQISVEKNIPFKQAQELAISEQVPQDRQWQVLLQQQAQQFAISKHIHAYKYQMHNVTKFTWPDSEQFPVRLQSADITPQSSRSTNTLQTIPDVWANPCQTQSGARTHPE